MLNPNELIGSAEAARIVGVDRATFNRWVAAGQVKVAGELPGHRGARMFQRKVIDRLAAAKQAS